MKNKDYDYLGILKIKKWYMFITFPVVAICLFLIIPIIDDLIIILFYGYSEFVDGLYLENSKNGVLSNGNTLRIEANIVRYLINIFSLFFIGYISNLIIKIIHLYYSKKLKK